VDEFVRITTPTIEDVPYPSEGLLAVPRDLAAGLYEVRSVAFFTDGVSRGDVVRCEPSGEHPLVAVEVVERSSGVTLLLTPLDDDGTDDRLRRLAEDLQDRFASELVVEGGMGMLTVVFDRAIESDVVGAIATHGAGDGSVDPVEQRLGDWYFHTVAYPDWPVPQRLAGTDKLFAATEHDGNP
jgi:hypothetical protein